MAMTKMKPICELKEISIQRKCEYNEDTGGAVILLQWSKWTNILAVVYRVSLLSPSIQWLTRENLLSVKAHQGRETYFSEKGLS